MNLPRRIFVVRKGRLLRRNKRAVENLLVGRNKVPDIRFYVVLNSNIEEEGQNKEVECM